MVRVTLVPDLLTALLTHPTDESIVQDITEPSAVLGVSPYTEG